MCGASGMRVARGEQCVQLLAHAAWQCWRCDSARRPCRPLAYPSPPPPPLLTCPRRTISALRSFFTATSLPVERSRQMRTSPKAPWHGGGAWRGSGERGVWGSAAGLLCCSNRLNRSAPKHQHSTVAIHAPSAPLHLADKLQWLKVVHAQALALQARVLALPPLMLCKSCCPLLLAQLWVALQLLLQLLAPGGIGEGWGVVERLRVLEWRRAEQQQQAECETIAHAGGCSDGWLHLNRTSPHLSRRSFTFWLCTLYRCSM